MTTTRMRTAGLAALAGLLMMASACSGDSGAGEATADGAALDEQVATVAETEATALEAERAADGAQAGVAEEASGDDLALGVSLDLGRQVIRTATIDLLFDDTRAAVRDITRLVERSGGFVAGADLRQVDRSAGSGDVEDSQVSGTMTLRVPVEEMTGTLAALEDLAAEVVARSVDTQDVTEEYADIEAQLRNLRAFEVQLLELLDQVEESDPKARELIAVFDRIEDVRRQIEQLQGRKQVLDDRIALATIDVMIAPTPDPVTVAASGWRPGKVLTEAVAATLSALQVVANVTIWLVVTALPVAVVVLGPLGLTVWARRRWRHTHSHPAPS